MTREFKYGLSIGGIVCAWILLQYAFGLHTTNVAVGAYLGYASNLIPFIGLFVLLRDRQRDRWDARLSFTRGIGSGFLTSLIAALVVYCFLSLYHTFINPDWADSMIEWQVNRMRLASMEEEVIRQRITAYRDAYSPGGLARATIVGMTLLGSVMALFITTLLRILPAPKAR
jgi:hypothetical protein